MHAAKYHIKNYVTLCVLGHHIYDSDPVTYILFLHQSHRSVCRYGRNDLLAAHVINKK